MIGESFLRDFFRVQPTVELHYEFIVTRETCPVTDNQHPSWAKPLFEAWVAEGWEVVSVTPKLSAPGSTFDCTAIGVLRKQIPAGRAE